MPQNSITGEYYLSGMHEMASGFLIKPDTGFEFFFTYGALDRYGSGNWQENNGQVSFQSKPQPLYDYALLQSKKVNSGHIAIRIKENNATIMQYVHVSLDNGKEGSWHKMETTGELSLPQQPIKSISLLFEFCPERFSTFKIDDPALNDFDFRFEPWLFEFFFDKFALKIADNELTGRHPLMEGDQFHYRRSPGPAND